jgi:hypothetical protein
LSQGRKGAGHRGLKAIKGAGHIGLKERKGRGPRETSSCTEGEK